MNRLCSVIGFLFLMAVLYHCIATFAYNWRHPELTQMQVLHDIVEAWCWK